MKLEGENVLLRVFVDSFQQWHHAALYEVIVERARRRNMAGATVLQGIEGFGMSGLILRERRWALANDHEVIVEVVDSGDKINAFLAEIEPMLKDAVVTTERARVVTYRHSAKGQQP